MAGWHRWGFVGVYAARGACAHKLSARLQSSLSFCLVKNAAFYTLSLLPSTLGITVVKLFFNPLSLKFVTVPARMRGMHVRWHGC